MVSLNKMNFVCLSLGSNLGDRLQNLQNCTGYIQDRIGEIMRRSDIYETEPSGYESINKYYNLCLQVGSDLNISDIMETIADIESTMGRKRVTNEYEDRIIDIDLLFYNDAIINSPAFTVPHPRLQERMFVLAPLAEICPDYIHPVLKKSVLELKIECREEGEIKIIF